MGSPLTGASNAGGVGKNRDSRPLYVFIPTAKWWHSCGEAWQLASWWHSSLHRLLFAWDGRRRVISSLGIVLKTTEHPARGEPRCTTCNSPPINSQCTNSPYFSIIVHSCAVFAARCYASAAHAVSVCLSVCVSVMFVHFIKMNKHTFEIFPPSGSQAILVFPYQSGWRYSNGNRMHGGYEKMTIFDQSLALSQKRL